MNKKEGTLMWDGNSDDTNVTDIGFGRKKILQKIFREEVRVGETFCPVRDVLSRISDKWSILAIYALGAFEVLRFHELKKRIPDVSQRMLTLTLRNLEQYGLVTRKVYAEVPPRVEYRLTPMGESLLDHLMQLSEWAMAYGVQQEKSPVEGKKV